LASIKVVNISLLSIHPEEQYALRVLRAGASGYLTKDSAPDELVTAIQKVSSGRKYISPSLADRLALNLQTNVELAAHETLSDREYHVMCLIASGKTVKDIAGELSLSVKTISTYRARILAKMRMNSNAELIRYAVQHELST
jgi:DNA-binding NarL/FixJ family response regulator